MVGYRVHRNQISKSLVRKSLLSNKKDSGLGYWAEVRSYLVYKMAANVESYTYVVILLASMCSWKELNGMCEFKELSL